MIATTEKRWDVLALGNTAVDDLLYVPHFPPPDAKVQVLRSERQCGGLAATALVAAARLGARCAYAGVIGEDELSRFVEDALQREGVDVSHAARRDDASPTHSRIIVDSTAGTRNIFYESKGMSGAASDHLAAEVIRAARVLLIDPWGEAGMLRAAQIAREASVPVVCDIERKNFDSFETLFALADHVVISRDFAFELTGASTPEAAATALWDEERAAVVVTCGADGCVVVSREYSDRAPRRHTAFKVEVVDTTGCGDVFHGAYAALLAEGRAIDKRIRTASACAALKAMRPGGQAGIPSRDVVKEFLSQSTS
jgi:ribokinase